MPSEFQVACRAGRDDVNITARVYEASGQPTTAAAAEASPQAETPVAWLILAPGAGAGHDHPFMVSFGRGLAARGLQVVTFNFPYIERGRRVPDGNETLEACWASVLDAVRGRAGSGAALFAGGKSMGGRIASQVAARADLAGRLSGLVFLGYPLHAPGRSKQDRTAHWPAIHVPALFVQGSRDSFATPEQLRAAIPRLGAPGTVVIVEEGDHSFKVPKRAGRSQEQVQSEILDGVVAWCSALLRHHPH